MDHASSKQDDVTPTIRRKGVRYTDLAATKSVDASAATSAPAPSAPYAFDQELPSLLITDELQKAIDRCKAKVDRISRECRLRNRRFRDIEFDLEEDKTRCLHGLNPSASAQFSPADVLRVHQIFEKPQFFVDGPPKSSGIIQGACGNCWFLSALSNIATLPGLIEKCCVARDEKVGVYGFIFYRDMGWVDVVVDDLLYTSAPKYEELTAREKLLYHEDKDRYNRNARRGGKSIYFSRSAIENETWVPLIEKAYAKIHGDYQALAGGATTEAVEDLTGAVSHVIHLNDIIDYDQFWEEEIMADDRLFACYMFSLSPPAPDTAAAETVQGLYPGHAYSILKAAEIRGKRLILLRNPWGKGEYTGRWSDGSKEWTSEWLDVLDIMDHRFGNDGEFLMEFSDFINLFTMIGRSRVFNSSWTLSQNWIRATSRTFPCAFSYGDVSFHITIPEKTLAVVALAQQDNRYFKAISGYTSWSLDFALFRKGEPEALATSQHSRFWGRSVQVELELDEGEYVVHARLDRSLIRSKDYFEKSYPDWSERKLSRVWAEKALSASVACNFDPAMYSNILPVLPDVYIGKTLTELETEAHQRQVEKDREVTQKKKAANAKRAATIKAALEVKKSPSLKETSDKPDSKTVDSKPVDPEPVAVVEVTGIDGGQPAEPPTAPSLPPALKALAMNTGLLTPAGGDLVDPFTKGKVKDGKSTPELVADALKSCEDANPDVDPSADTESNAAVESNAKDGSPASDPGIVDETKAESEPAEDEKVVHEGICCDGCGMAPIVGKRYRCLAVTCPDFDLCEDCVRMEGAHDSHHKFLEIEAPDQGAKLYDKIISGDDNSVVLGMRVYTQRTSPATVTAQLRHGKLIPWKT